jgi:hypothetical protein
MFNSGEGTWLLALSYKLELSCQMLTTMRSTPKTQLKGRDPRQKIVLYFHYRYSSCWFSSGAVGSSRRYTKAQVKYCSLIKYLAYTNTIENTTVLLTLLSLPFS